MGVGLPADRHTKALHPLVQRSAELDKAGLVADRHRLHVEQDEAGFGAERQAALEPAAALTDAPRFDEQAAPAVFALPCAHTGVAVWQ